MSDVFYPDLKIVPIKDIKLQEYVQKSRMGKLAETIKKEGILRNPPIVTNFFNGTYMHLDGANRITAVSILGYPNCLVQIVDYSDPTHVNLSTWSHLTNVAKDEFLAGIRALPGVSTETSKRFDRRSLFKPKLVCVAVFYDGTTVDVLFKGSFSDRVRTMGKVVDLYADKRVERVFSGSPWTVESINVRFARFPEHNVFIAFPQFSPSQIITLVDSGVLMPAGVTRHIVYRRKLNVNIPLAYLKMRPLEKANVELQKFLQHRTVRLYEEPIIYFE